MAGFPNYSITWYQDIGHRTIYVSIKRILGVKIIDTTGSISTEMELANMRYTINYAVRHKHKIPQS